MDRLVTRFIHATRQIRENANKLVQRKEKKISFANVIQDTNLMPIMKLATKSIHVTVKI
jgi:hypothetical protein